MKLRKKTVQALALFLSVSVMAGLCSVSALAEGDEGSMEKEGASFLLPPDDGATIGASVLSRSGGIAVAGGVANQDYSYAGGVLTIFTGTPMTLTGTVNDESIVVASGVQADLTFKDLSVTCSAKRPFDMSGATVRLHLQGNNVLESANYKTALYCPKGSSLTVDGSGALKASTDSKGGAAAIGGEAAATAGGQDWTQGACGSITINSGTIDAQSPLSGASSEQYCAAIGGYGGGPVTINGGIVKAIGGENSVGIGSLGKTFEGIFINGGSVTAQSNGISMDDMGASTALGPAIGVVGAYDSSIPITITGGEVNAKGAFGCAGIGGGRNGSSNRITITGNAKVTASGGHGAAGIGAGYAQNGGGSADVITINGDAAVIAKGGDNAPGIGGGAPRNQGSGVGPDGSCGVIIVGGNADVTATGGANAHGFGSGGSQGGNFPDQSIINKIIFTGNPTIHGDVGPGNLGSGSPSKEQRFLEFICTVPGITAVEAQNSLTVGNDGSYTVKGTVALDTEVSIAPGSTIHIPTGSTLYVSESISFDPSSVTVTGGGNIVKGDPPPPADTFLLTVTGGTGGGRLKKNASPFSRTITATVPEGYRFVKWEKVSGSVTLQNPTDPECTLILYNTDAAVRAVFEALPSTVTRVAVYPQSVTVTKGTRQQFTAVVEGSGAYSHEVLWSVSGAGAGTTISSSGLLTVDEKEAAASLTVTAASAAAPTVYGEAHLTLSDLPVQRYAVTVENGSGSGSYPSGASVMIRATVPANQEFVKWQQQGAGTIADAQKEETSFIVGDGDVILTAIFKDKNDSSSSSSGSDSSSSGSDSSSSGSDSSSSGSDSSSSGSDSSSSGSDSSSSGSDSSSSGSDSSSSGSDSSSSGSDSSSSSSGFPGPVEDLPPPISGSTGGGTSKSRDTSSDSDWNRPSTTVVTKKAVSSDDVIKALKKNPKSNVTIRDASSVPLQSLHAIAQEIRSQNGHSLLHADTTANGKVVGRVTIDPLQAGDGTGEIQLGVHTDAKNTGKVKKLFEKYFINTIRAVHLDQKGSFGIPVKVAVKLEFSGIDVKDLVLYSYDAASNTYTRLPNPAQWLDKNGYLHFTTSTGGTIILSENQLAKG